MATPAPGDAPTEAAAPGREPEVSPGEAIQTFQKMKRDAQLVMDKISELQYELGEHELVETNMGKLPDDRAAYRLVGGVLIKQTVGEVLPKVRENRANLEHTIKTMQSVLSEKTTAAAAWKQKYGIRTQQEHELDQRARQQRAAAEDGRPAPAESAGVLA